MLKLTKIAQKQQTPLEYEIESTSFHDNPNVAMTKLLQEISFLKERNRHLEAKISRLCNELQSVDSELALREKICDERARLINAAIAKFYAKKKEIDASLLNCERHIQEAQSQHIRDTQRYQSITEELKQSIQKIAQLNQIIHEITQDKLRLEQQLDDAMKRIAEFEHANSTDLYREERKHPYTSAINEEEPTKEAYSVNSIHLTETNKNTKKDLDQYGKPFGYNQANPGIYLRGIHQNINRTDNRVSMLQEKVDMLSGEISQIKEYLREICNALNEKKEGAPHPNTNLYGGLQNFIDNDH